jgi:hypothetical protein
VSEQRRSVEGLAMLAPGMVIGAVEVVIAVSIAALVFGGHLADFVDESIGIYLGRRGVDAKALDSLLD